MKEIAIFGAGGFGKEVACLIAQINEAGGEWNLVGFFDDGVEKGTQISHYGQVLGGVKELNEWPSQLSVAIAIGSPHALRFVQERINNPNISFPNLIHPVFTILDKESFKIGKGNIILAACYVSCNTSIGDFNILNGEVVMGHDATIGNYNVLMPDIKVSGEVKIGEENLIGIGTIILQQIKIGTGVHIGAGAVLMTKPKDGCTYIGNPARRFKFE